MPAVPLPPDHLACPGCGVAVPPSQQGGVITATVLPTGAPGAPPPPHAQSRQVSFTRCPSCAALRERAEALVADHPRLAHRLGPDTAVHRVECGLLALDAVGLPAPDAPDEGAVADLVRLLFPVGTGVRWLARFSPSLTVPLGTCTAAPWGHLLDEQRQACLSARASMLRARVARSAPPVAVASPSHGGCLMCGVSAVRVAAVRVEQDGGPQVTARDVWRPVTTTCNALGGPPSPALLAGHLCPACAAALDAVGAVGPTAMERAVREHLGIDGPAVPLDGLVGWASSGRPPNAAPWDHCDLSALSATG
jgi:hypothetical protein